MIEHWGVFLGITVLFLGGCAFMTGQALAATWRPQWQAVPYALLLAAAGRFLAFALFGGELLSFGYFGTEALLLVAVTLAAYRLTLARRMVDQYPWLHERDGLFAWRHKGGS